MYMNFFHQGELTGFDGDLIHVFNKNENAVHDSEYFRRLQGRSNVLLMGDSLGDLNMADGADAKHLLKIGFLNDKVYRTLCFSTLIVESSYSEIFVGHLCDPSLVD